MPCTRHRNGRQIVPQDGEALGDWIEAQPVNWKGTITITDEVKPKTKGDKDNEGNQLGFYFGPMNEILREKVWFTTSKDDAYYRTLGETSYTLKANPKGGHPLKDLIHVSDMNREELAKHIEAVQMWAAESAGVFIPDPDPTKSKRWAATFQARGYAAA